MSAESVSRATPDTASPAVPAVSTPTRTQQIVLVCSLGIGIFITAINSSVSNAILPIIAREYQTNISSVEWVITCFLLVQSGTFLTFGRLGDLIGHRKVYLTGLAIFSVCSALSGLAPSTLWLIAARCCQALGAAMFIANSAPILTSFFPPSARGRVLGFQSSFVYIGLATGPALGGIIADLFGWRWVFFMPLPLGIVAFVLNYNLLRRDRPTARRETFDLAGAAVYIVGLITLLLALNRGGEWGWLSPFTLGFGVAGLCLLLLFVAIELRVQSPMLQLSLFSQRAFAAPVCSAMLNYAAAATAAFLLPFALIQGRGLSVGQAGLVLSCQPIVMTAMTVISGFLSDRIGSRIPSTLGMGILATSLLLLSRIDLDTSLTAIAVVMTVSGFGLGMFAAPNNSSVLGAVGPERRGVATGVVSTARTLGNVLGIGLSGAVFAGIISRSASPEPTVVMQAASTGLMLAAGFALVGMVTSATRPGHVRED